MRFPCHLLPPVQKMSVGLVKLPAGVVLGLGRPNARQMWAIRALRSTLRSPSIL